MVISSRKFFKAAQVRRTYFFIFCSKAKLLLRKKKFQENLLEKTDGQLENVERMVCRSIFANNTEELLFWWNTLFLCITTCYTVSYPPHITRNAWMILFPCGYIAYVGSGKYLVFNYITTAGS